MKKTLIIIHGSKEHSKRYKEFSNTIEEKGINLVTGDISSHGDKFNGKSHNFTFDDVLDSALLIIDNAIMNNKGNKIYVLGHSFGSFIVKYIVYNNLRDFDGVILSGTNHMPSSLVKLGLSLSSKGNEEKVSKILEFMSYGILGVKSFFHNGTSNWLSTNKENFKSFKNDPLCGNPFTKKSLYSMFKFMELSQSIDMLEKFKNKELRHLIIYGKKDPVSNFGKEIKQMVKLHNKIGIKNNKVIEYKDSKHEVIFDNEKKKVINDIIIFLND